MNDGWMSNIDGQEAHGPSTMMLWINAVGGLFGEWIKYLTLPT